MAKNNVKHQWVKFFMSHWTGGSVQLLGVAERGAYHEILVLIWQGLVVPNDDDFMARITACDNVDQWLRIKGRLIDNNNIKISRGNIVTVNGRAEEMASVSLANYKQRCEQIEIARAAKEAQSAAETQVSAETTPPEDNEQYQPPGLLPGMEPGGEEGRRKKEDNTSLNKLSKRGAFVWGKVKKSGNRDPETFWPEGWVLSQEEKDYLHDIKGFSYVFIGKWFEDFESKSKAKQFKYRDWRHGLLNWLIKQRTWDQEASDRRQGRINTDKPGSAKNAAAVGSVPPASRLSEKAAAYQATLPDGCTMGEVIANYGKIPDKYLK